MRASSTTDELHGNFWPATDGYHLAWLRANANGANAEVQLFGGLSLNDGEVAVTPGSESPLQCNRGQFLWKDSQANLQYAIRGTIDSVCTAPAAQFDGPWLADGFVAGFGNVQGSVQTDNEVFLYEGYPPDDAERPLPPFMLIPAAGSHRVELQWDAILGATSYNLYLAETPGITKETFASLPAGRRIEAIIANSIEICSLPNDTTYWFAVTAVNDEGEGGVSVEVSATPTSGSPSNLEEITRLIRCLSGPGAESPPQGCSSESYANADLTCDSHVDLKDFSVLANFQTE